MGRLSLKKAFDSLIGVLQMNAHRLGRTGGIARANGFANPDVLRKRRLVRVLQISNDGLLAPSDKVPQTAHRFDEPLIAAVPEVEVMDEQVDLREQFVLFLLVAKRSVPAYRETGRCVLLQSG